MSSTVSAGRIRIFRTSRDTPDRIADGGFIPLESGRAKTGPVVTVDPSRKCQEILGFGGTFTEASCFILSSMSEEKRTEILQAYFNREKGLGYVLARTHMNSSDFSTGNYSCDDVSGDADLRFFTIDRDRRYLIPMIRSANVMRGEPLRLFISPWSPPAWMKTNGRMNHGGKLRAEYRESWARFYAKFIRSYEEEGIPVWGLTVQNEPQAVQVWDSCIYSAEEERNFVRDFLGPVLEKEGLGDKKIIIWDHNRDLIYERAKTVLSDPEAARYVWGTGYHWYSGDQFENVAKTHDAFPGKGLLFTEGCCEGGPVYGSWDCGERYGHNIINDLNHWANGWTDWNLVLDESGGPNHAANFCDAPVLADPVTDTVEYRSSFYYMGHFSKFIRPGARRLHSRSTQAGIEAVAAENPDGSSVVVIMNPGERVTEIRLEIGTVATGLRLEGHSIISLVI